MNAALLDNMTAIQRNKNKLLREIADITRVLSEILAAGDVDRVHALLDDRERKIDEAKVFDAAYEEQRAQLDESDRVLVDSVKTASLRGGQPPEQEALAAFCRVLTEQRGILVDMKRLEDGNTQKAKALVADVKKQLSGIQKNRDITDRYITDFQPEPGTLFDKKK